jgi:hypothetical protein
VLDLLRDAVGWLGQFAGFVTAVGALGAWTFAAIRKRGRRRRVQRFFGGDELRIVMPIRLLGARRCVAEEDFKASTALSAFLGRHGIVTTFGYVEPDGSIDLAVPGLIVICGPKNSPVVARAIEQAADHAFVERGAGWHIEHVGSGEAFRSPVDEGSPFDVAYLGRSRRRPGAPGSFVIIAGVHAVGSLGVVHFLADYGRVRRLDRLTSGALFSSVVASEHALDGSRILASELQSISIGDSIEVADGFQATVR